MIELTLSVQADKAVIEISNLYDQEMSTLESGRLFDRFTRHPESGGKQQIGLEPITDDQNSLS